MMIRRSQYLMIQDDVFEKNLTGNETKYWGKLWNRNRLCADGVDEKEGVPGLGC